MTYIASIRTATIALATLFTTAAFAQDIRIGFHVPQTGFAAADGKSALHGAELAVEQINAKGGVLGRKLALVVYDDQAKAACLAMASRSSFPEATRHPRARRREFSSKRKSRTSPPTPFIPTSHVPAITSSALPSWVKCRAGPAPSSSAKY